MRQAQNIFQDLRNLFKRNKNNAKRREGSDKNKLREVLSQKIEKFLERLNLGDRIKIESKFFPEPSPKGKRRNILLYVCLSDSFLSKLLSDFT